MTTIIGLILGMVLGIIGREMWPRRREVIMAVILLLAHRLVHGRAVVSNAANVVLNTHDRQSCSSPAFLQ
jgi:hypothetical protein